MTPRPVVHFPGGASGNSAYALINRHWIDGLRATGRFAVSLGESWPSPPPDYVIHHDFERPFTAFEGPAGATCILARPWDFGPYPPAWVEAIQTRFDQLWVPSRWSASLAEAGGVDPERVRVVPLGVNERIFRPDGPSSDLATRAGFHFLFVGGVSLRKGTDLLLAAYLRAFSDADDTCLVLKDHSADVFYGNDELRARVRDAAADPGAPEILYIDDFLPEEELAGLYRACDVAVFPYRAEGFCMPILEAMASGTPAIVPRFGACLDYCSEATSFLTRARRMSLPVDRDFSFGIGLTAKVEEVDFCEVPIEALVDLLRHVRSAAVTEVRSRALAGVARAHEDFTWSRSVACAVSNLASADRPPGSAPRSSPS